MGADAYLTPATGMHIFCSIGYFIKNEKKEAIRKKCLHSTKHH